MDIFLIVSKVNETNGSPISGFPGTVHFFQKNFHLIKGHLLHFLRCFDAWAKPFASLKGLLFLVLYVFPKANNFWNFFEMVFDFPVGVVFESQGYPLCYFSEL